MLYFYVIFCILILNQIEIIQSKTEKDVVKKISLKNSKNKTSELEKESKAFNSNKKQYNIQIIAEPNNDDDKSYLSRYQKKLYSPFGILRKQNFTNNNQNYDIDVNVNNDNGPYSPTTISKLKKRKKVKPITSQPDYTFFNEENIALTSLGQSLIGTTDFDSSKKKADYYKYLVGQSQNKFHHGLITEQSVFDNNHSTTTFRPQRPNVIFFTTTSMPVTQHFLDHGISQSPISFHENELFDQPNPTLHSFTTIEDSIKRPSSTTFSASTTPTTSFTTKLQPNFIPNANSIDFTTERPPLKKIPIEHSIAEWEKKVKNKSGENIIKIIKPLSRGAVHYEFESNEIDTVYHEDDSIDLDQIPGVNAFSNFFEHAYDFVDDSITSHELVEIKEKGQPKKKTKMKKGKKKGAKKKKHHKKKKHSHHDKKKKKKHHHHDYDYKKKKVIKKGGHKKKGHKKKKIIKKKKGCHAEDKNHYYYYYVDKKESSEEHDDYKEYEHEDEESYEEEHKHHKKHKKKKKHHHEEEESESYDDDHSYEYRTLQKRDTKEAINKKPKNMLTTSIRVTNELIPPTVKTTTPPYVINETSTSRSPNKEFESSSSKSEALSKETSSYEDDYGSFGIDFDGESESATDEDYESKEYMSENLKNKKYDNDKFNKLFKKKKTQKHSKYDDYDDDEPEGFFDYIMRSVSQFFSSFSQSPKPKRKKYDDYDDDYSEETGRSTTPRMEYRKPKIDQSAHNNIQTRTKLWNYPSFLFNSKENNEMIVLPTASPAPITPITENNRWFDMFNPLKIFSYFYENNKSNSIIAPLSSEDDSIVSQESNWISNSIQTIPTVSPVFDPGRPVNAPTNWNTVLNTIRNVTQSIRPIPQVPHIYSENHDSIKNNYDGYQMWRILPTTQEHVNILTEYRQNEEDINLMWLKGPSLRGVTDVIISPQHLETFKEYLDDEEIPYHITIFNIGKAIMYENPQWRQKNDIDHGSMSWYFYYSYADILKFLDYIQRNYSKYVELIPIGSSYEGRPLIIAKISTMAKPLSNNIVEQNDKKKKKKYHYKKSNRSVKPAIFIEAGSHGRDWQGIASATWIINHLVENADKNNTVSQLIENIDWFILPVLNPDGYAYSYVYDRMWRKTRSKVEKKDDFISAAFNWLQSDSDEKVPKQKKYCYGVDLNRNWDDSWGLVGASKDPCNDYFAGTSPFSEPESKALSKFLMEHKKKIKIYTSFHSYGQTISFPPSPSFSYIHDKYDDLFDMAIVALQKLRSSGSSTKYLIDTTSDMIYHRSGSVDSYAMNQVGVPFAFNLGLRGTNGLLLPANQITMAAEEAFHLVHGMVDYLQF